MDKLYQNITPAEAVALQHEMRGQLAVNTYNGPLHTIGGADISFNKYEKTVYAGIVVLSYPQLQVIERATIVTETEYPYISGLLAFREVPALLSVWETLKNKPDVLMLDGQGIAHPRRLGIATHFGMVANVVTIGCAKSRLTGTYAEPGDEAFASTPLYHQKEMIGEVLRSKKKCKPLFISPGHKIDIAQSVAIVKNCVKQYRMPEPTRLAHLLVNEVRIAHKNAVAGGGMFQQEL